MGQSGSLQPTIRRVVLIYSFMKTSPSRVAISALACLTLWLAPGAAGLRAQSAAPVAPPAIKDAPPKPPDDPFVTTAKPVPPKPPVAAVVEDEPSYNMVFCFETYRLPQATLDALHEEALGQRPFYDRVRKLTGSGQASLESVVALPTRSGQRAAAESIDEFVYATEFSSPVAGRPFGFPNAYEMRPMGERLELDPVARPGGTVADLNTSFEFTRLAGFTAVKADPSAEGELQPVVVTRKITTATTCQLDAPTLLGTMSAPWGTGVQGADGDGSVSLTFVRYRHSTPSAPQVALPASQKGESNWPEKNIRMVYRFYSLPRAKARDLLEETMDADTLLQRTAALPKEEGKLERLLTVITRTGQRCTTEEIGEWIYGTEVDPSAPPAPKVKGTNARPPAAVNAKDATGNLTPPPVDAQTQGSAMPAIFTAFEMRPTGWRIEVDPVLAPDEAEVFLNLAPIRSEYRGVVQGHPLLARYPEWPIFGTQKVTTAVTAVVGRQCFLGTFSTPRETGVNDRKDDGRTWFAFVKATIE